jgi:hypothetical protein
LKIRKISGRHQISADGKHLVDGLAFGRPLLRRPADRPAVNIPPRKRRKVTYNEDEDDDEGFLALKEQEAEDEESEAETNNRQLVLHTDFEDDDSEEDEDFVPGEDEELDEDEEAEAEADEDDTTENEVEEQATPMESATESQREEAENEDENESALANVSGEETRTKIRKLHSAFPTSPITVCMDVLDGSGGDIGEAYTTMSLGFQPAKPKSAITESTKASLSVRKTRSKKRNAPAEEVEASDSMQVEAAETADSLLLDYYDQNGLPLGSISSGKALSHMAEAVQNSPGKSRPTSQRSNSALSSKSVRFSLDEGLTNGFTSTLAIDRESHVDDSDEDSGDSSSDATSSGNSSSGSSSSDEDSSSSESKEDAEVSDTSTSGSDSGSSSDSSSDDDAPEETSSKATNATPAKSAPFSTEISPLKPLTGATAPPGQGKKATQARNQRRRGANILNRFKAKGILPTGTTRTEFMQLSEVTSDTSPDDALAALEAVRSTEINKTTNRTVAKKEEFEARRQELLASLESGGIEIRLEPSNKSPKRVPKVPFVQAEENAIDTRSSPVLPSIEDSQDISNLLSIAPETHQPPSANDTFQTQAEDETAKAASQIVPRATTPPASATSSKPATPSAESVSKEATPSPSATKSKPPPPASESVRGSATTPRRAKLDVGAGRRMLFGALGVKTPKSKKDEEKVRSEFMKDVRPIHTPKTAEKVPEDEEEVEAQDPEAWREKIIYRAVECCHDGIELSEPPFPFVQRWDPQQQGGWSQKGKNGGKSKKNQRDESQYYQAERPSKKQKQRKSKYRYAEQQEYLDASYEPSYQEESIMESEEPTHKTRLPTDDIEGEINQQLMHLLNEDASAQVSQGPEDLAALPEDPTTLSDLKDGEAKPGMTIAFKQLTMSEETKWQPEISDYRTAVVNVILGGGELQLTLALRDRLDHEKFYDAETGKRVYGRFDMPDQDEEAEEDEDDGIRNLTFSELVEPKIVQDAPTDLGIDNPADERVLPKFSFNTEPQTFRHEDAAADAQFSHVTETPLNSDAPESSAQDSNHESIRDSPQPNPQNLDRSMNEEGNSRLDNLDAAPEEVVPKPAADEKLMEGVIMTEYQGGVPYVEKGKAKQTVEDNTTGEPITLEEQESVASLDETDISISNDARLRISQMMKDAGFRSSVPSSVMKDIRPTGMESPGDAEVFEKLLKDMTEIESNPPYSPKFHGLDPSSPIKKLKPISTDRVPSSSLVRVQTSWQTVDSEAPSSPPLMNDNEESSVTMDPEDISSSPVKVPSKGIAQKFKVPNLGKAQELWEALQPKSRRSSVSPKGSKASPGPSTGLDGANDTSVQYPRLSVGSSLTSQISDHGRQPDVSFGDSTGLSGDTPKAPAFEDDSFMNEQDDPMADVEQELPSHKSTNSSSDRQKPDGLFLDDEELHIPRRSRTNGSSKSRSKSHDVLQGSSSSDDAFPSLEEVISQRDTTREKVTSVRSRPPRQIKAEKMQKNTGDQLSEDEEEEITPKASQKNSRPSRREHSLPSGSQIRKSPGNSQVRGSQPSASEAPPSQSQPKFVIPQGSQVMDLTMSSSDIEDEEDVVVPEVEQPKRFRKYSLDDNDDDDYFEEGGWVPKKSSQKVVDSRRQTSTGLKASSQSSLNTSRRKTTARF